MSKGAMEDDISVPDDQRSRARDEWSSACMCAGSEGLNKVASQALRCRNLSLIVVPCIVQALHTPICIYYCFIILYSIYIHWVFQLPNRVVSRLYTLVSPPWGGGAVKEENQAKKRKVGK